MRWLLLFAVFIAGLLFAASLVSGCVGPVEMNACGSACAKNGVKKLHWNGECECYPPQDKTTIEVK